MVGERIGDLQTRFTVCWMEVISVYIIIHISNGPHPILKYLSVIFDKIERY